MTFFKRISATLFSRIDQVVGEIENHEAVIQASLNEMADKIARAKSVLNQSQCEKSRISEKLLNEQQNIQRWRKRAVDCAKTDEDKALECLRRAQNCTTLADTLKKTLGQYQQSIAKMENDIKTGEQRLAEMKHKLTLMRSRAATCSMNTALDTPENHTEQLLDDTFSRWEININRSEILFDHTESMDTIEQEFITKEQQENLRNELAELLAKEEK